MEVFTLRNTRVSVFRQHYWTVKDIVPRNFRPSQKRKFRHPVYGHGILYAQKHFCELGVSMDVLIMDSHKINMGCGKAFSPTIMLEAC